MVTDLTLTHIFIGNNGNKSSASHNDGVNTVTDNVNDSASESDLLPIGQPASSASTPGGCHIVTVVTAGRHITRPCVR